MTGARRGTLLCAIALRQVRSTIAPPSAGPAGRRRVKVHASVPVAREDTVEHQGVNSHIDLAMGLSCAHE
jgi:hypothetical protein